MSGKQRENLRLCDVGSSRQRNSSHPYAALPGIGPTPACVGDIGRPDSGGSASCSEAARLLRSKMLSSLELHL